MNDNPLNSSSNKILKRLFDIFFSFMFLLFFFWIYVLVALLIKVSNPGPIFFKQKRRGKSEEIFTCYKFRTMQYTSEESNNITLMNDRRVFFIGKYLRKYNLDELPQFFNVLKGDMSVIGPRPLLQRYLSRYNDEQIRRLEVKPGITGLAQVKGRNLLSWEERFKYDLKYVDSHNFFFDIEILILTLFQLFLRRGVNTKDEQIMPEFFGKDDRP